jgi:hypothetical protein
MLVEKTTGKPRHKKVFIPCPHCGSVHNNNIFEVENGKAYGNWFGIYCPGCGGIIPCQRNLTSLLLIVLTYPLWKPFIKPVKQHWMSFQKNRYADNDEPVLLTHDEKNKPGFGMALGTVCIPALLLLQTDAIDWYIFLVAIPAFIIFCIAISHIMNRWLQRLLR